MKAIIVALVGLVLCMGVLTGCGVPTDSFPACQTANGAVVAYVDGPGPHAYVHCGYAGMTTWQWVPQQ